MKQQNSDTVNQLNSSVYSCWFAVNGLIQFTEKLNWSAIILSFISHSKGAKNEN